MKTPEPPPDLTDAVLRATSGPVCGSARERLCDWVDGLLEQVDHELVAAHARTCRECASLAASLRAMSTDLPLLAEMEPGPGFTASVLEATARERRLPLVARMASAWQQLLQRPRFAWEGAYIGAFVMVLLFGTSSSPLAGIPQRALALAALNPVEEIRKPVSRLEESLSTEVREAWSATRVRVVATSTNVAGKIQGSFAGLLSAFDPNARAEESPGEEWTEPDRPAGRLSDGERSETDTDDPNDRLRENRNQADGDKR